MRPLHLLLVLVLLLVPRHARAEEEAQLASVPDALAEVAALKARGGHVAPLRLRALLAEGTLEVRVAALRALADVGLRSEATAEAVRRALETTHAAEREAALEALGRVGDGDDVEVFLGALREEDAAVRSAALQGLRDLTRRRLPASPTRCSLWWRSSARGMRKAVRNALASLPDASDRQIQAWREDLARDGWIEREALMAAVREWLRAPDHRLRAVGFHLATTLRLADLVPDVESALPYVSNADAEEGVEAVRVLGVSPQLLPPYWQRRIAGPDGATGSDRDL